MATKLTEHFSLEELTVSPTAKKLGLPNTPTQEHIANMKYVCEKILEPVRAHFGKPVQINSSYRSPAVNKAVGGSKTSQHSNGEAVDFEIPGIPNKKLADWVADNLEFDQVILEFYNAKDGANSGWVHASIKRNGQNRKQRLIATKSKAGGTVYTPVADFDPSTTRDATSAASSAPEAAAQPTAKVASNVQGLGPLAALQAKCGLTPDGKWGQGTYRAAKTYFKLSNAQAAHFFGQCAHESGNFKVFSENLNYSADGLNKIFPKYFVKAGRNAAPYARKPEKIANVVYSGRMGNGNEASGDGWRYRGRGPIQLTGKDNYTAFAKDIGRPDVMTNPDLVCGELAFESALWFFRKNGLLTIADKGVTDAVITQITKRVNGGTHGLDDRVKKTKQFFAWG